MAERLTIVVGAGFSAPAHIPLQGEIIKRLVTSNQEASPEPQNLKAEDDVKRFFQTYFCGVSDEASQVTQRMLGTSLEDICTTLDSALRRLDLPPPGVSLRDVEQSLKVLIARVIRDASEKANIEEYTMWLDNCRKKDRLVTIISLNWDTVIEQAADQLKQEVNCGTTIEAVPRKQAMKGGYQRGLVLLKLHGSVDWGECPHCRSVLRFSEPPRLPVGNCPRCDDKGAAVRGILALPSMRREALNPRIEILWDEALHALREADKVAIIGYSLPPADHDVRYLLRAALHDKGNGAATVVLKHKRGGVVERYQSLFGWAGECFQFGGTRTYLKSP